VDMARSYCSAVSADPLALISIGEKGSVSPTFVPAFLGSRTHQASNNLHKVLPNPKDPFYSAETHGYGEQILSTPGPRL